MNGYDKHFSCSECDKKCAIINALVWKHEIGEEPTIGDTLWKRGNTFNE